MKTKSIWGKSPSRLYEFKKMIESKFGNKGNICIVGASDGKFVFPFLRNGLYVTAYELDEVAINGGEKEFPLPRVNITKMSYEKNPDRNPIYHKVPSEYKMIQGLIKRAELEGLKDNLTIKQENFYKNPPKAKFDALFTSCSIPYPCNFDIPVNEIINALKGSVRKEGYLYMDYMMPLEDCHSWRPEHYIRKGQMKKLIEDDNWKIIKLYEMARPVFEAAHVDRPEDHFHRFGYVLAEYK